MMKLKLIQILFIALTGLIMFNACNDSKDGGNEDINSEQKNNSSNTTTPNDDLYYEIIEVIDEEGNLIYNEDGTIKRDTVFYSKKPEIDTSKYALFSVIEFNTGDESYIVHNKLKTDTKQINTPCDCVESLSELLKNIIEPSINDPQLSAPKDMFQAYYHYYDYVQNHCINKLKFKEKDMKNCENFELLKTLRKKFNKISNTGYHLVNKVDEQGNIVFANDGSAMQDTVNLK